jgi:predicted Zn-dependent protease
LNNQNQPQKAQRYLDRLMAMNHFDASLHRRQAEFLMRQGEVQKAIEAFKLALEVDPTQIEVRRELADALNAAGETEKQQAELDVIRRMREAFEGLQQQTP